MVSYPDCNPGTCTHTVSKVAGLWTKTFHLCMKGLNPDITMISIILFLPHAGIGNKLFHVSTYKSFSTTKISKPTHTHNKTIVITSI